MPHDIIILTVGVILGFLAGLAGCLFNRRFVAEENTERVNHLELRLADMTDSRNYYREAVEQKRGRVPGPRTAEQVRRDRDDSLALAIFSANQSYSPKDNQPKKEPNNYGP